MKCKSFGLLFICFASYIQMRDITTMTIILVNNCIVWCAYCSKVSNLKLHQAVEIELKLLWEVSDPWWCCEVMLLQVGLCFVCIMHVHEHAHAHMQAHCDSQPAFLSFPLH